MLLEIAIKNIILWTCVCVFILTSLITLLALVKVIKLADDIYLKRLFYALVLEVVAISIWGFGDAIKGGGGTVHENYVAITNPSSWIWMPGKAVPQRKVFINGVFFRAKDSYTLVSTAFFNQRQYNCTPFSFSKDIFTSSVDIPGDTSGNLTVNVSLYDQIEKKTTPLAHDEVVVPIKQDKQ